VSELRVLAFGAWDSGAGYPRADALLLGLRSSGCLVDECRFELPFAGTEKRRLLTSPWLWPGYWWSLRKAKQQAIRALTAAVEAHRPDVVLVPYPGHLVVRWVREAFEALEAAGYHVRSAYTAVKDPSRTHFIYTDRLWQGADMVGLGVASFGHINGVHVQNLDTWETYSAAIREGGVALNRGYKPTGEERMIRELILQLKFGSITPAYFRDKYQVNVLERFRPQLDSLGADGYLQTATADRVALNREGLLRVDALLSQFFLPEHAGIRYT